MLSLLMPLPLVSAEEFGDIDDAPLYPQEAALVARAVDGRRREFATGRACARRALGRLGLPPGPILSQERGAPSWPDGVVGSLTHCEGYRAAALGLRRDVRAIGIDAEPDAPLPAGVLEVIALDEEAAMVRALAAARPGPSWDRLLFSAKEAVYKAWFPLTRRPLDFTQALIEVEPDGSFTARLLVPGPLPGFHGRWLAARGLLVTAITVPAR
ncbi:4'-phosphopantetheinyl transferase family protein [Streptomyces sediminimaris]|uniref:4'-phosphopantetheinyl transferase family protein n=1 Tax=Streptomyces sediminimaris TaxID=3383721 RepID=UPI00399C1F83